MEINYGIVKTENIKDVVLPPEWGGISWIDITRDGINYKLITFLSNAQDSFRNTLYLIFNNQTDYTIWLNQPPVYVLGDNNTITIYKGIPGSYVEAKLLIPKND
jgi:hypothetical protein